MQIVLYQVGEINSRHQSEISLWDHVDVVPLRSVVEPLWCVTRLLPPLRFHSEQC